MTARLLPLSLLLVAACNDKSDPVDPVDTGEVDPVDSDGDGFSAEEDCDDTDASISPDADELCDGVDNNCDGEIDEDTAVDAGTWYADADTDGYGDAGAAITTCSVPSGYTDDATDCDDTSADINPAADEYCDGIDNDCNGQTDEDSAVDASEWYEDADGDGYGNVNAPTVTCSAPSGYVADNTDCDDTEPAAYTGATEYCDGVDNDCNGQTDDASSVDAATWYGDADGDGFGSDQFTTIACSQPGGHVANDDDCDDYDATTNPLATEYCDGEDNDCDGDTDDDDSSLDTTTASTFLSLIHI